MEYYSAIKKNKIVPSAEKYKYLEEAIGSVYLFIP